MPDIQPERATPSDLDAIAGLLASVDLTTAGLSPDLGPVFIVRRNGRLIGVAAVEQYVDGALFRSLAVADDFRNSGLGAALTRTAMRWAAEQHVGSLFLLTETASAYFPRFGFRKISREAVPPGVRSSVEFASACPQSADVFEIRLDDSFPEEARPIP